MSSKSPSRPDSISSKSRAILPALVAMFEFTLRPMDEIAPWGRPGDLSLSWFALTDGYYHLDVGGQKIWRYSEEGCRAQGWSFPPSPPGFELSVAYQVARPFEDLIEILPSVLEPVPADIARHLETAEAHRSWNDFVSDWDWHDDTEGGLLWVCDRTLDSGYLRAGPDITFWRVDDVIRIRCDNRDKLLDGVAIWSSALVELELPLGVFLDAVRAFGNDLIAQMDERTTAVERGWSRDGVRLKAADLRRDHEERATWLEAAVARRRPPTDWPMVRRTRPFGGSS